jgi:flagellum-specific ATP synthase
MAYVRSFALSHAVRARAAELLAGGLSGRIDGADGGGRITIAGVRPFALTGSRVRIPTNGAADAGYELTEQAGDLARAMPLHGSATAIPSGDAIVRLPLGARTVAVDDLWLGRVFDALLRPLDAGGPLPPGSAPYALYAAPPTPDGRELLGPRIDTGVRAINLFATCRQGQRLGVFAGSGVGKSSLMSMILRHCAYDVAVIALVGERGREVREFVETHLGRDGLRTASVVVATSDASPLLQRDAAYTAMAVAEYFRDRGRSVLFLFDSITRFCMALRELALRAGEPPAARGYPPGVFSELARFLERAGPGRASAGAVGSITAFFNVLVDGDDLAEPVADAARGILDGHIVLDRRLVEAGRYPPIDVMRSLSRTAAECNTEAENDLIRQAREVLRTSASTADLLRLGAYRRGGDPTLDAALDVASAIEALLRQPVSEPSALPSDFLRLGKVLLGP